MLAIPPPPPAQVSPAPLEAATLAFCQEVASQMALEELESKAAPRRLQLLKKQAQQLLNASAGGPLPGDRTRPLLEAALGALELATDQAAQGERRYGRAAKALAVRWRRAQLALGLRHSQLLPELEALALLYRLGGLRDAHWRDEALRIRVSQPQGLDPTLEKDLAAAVEDHYGPWLTVAEVEPMLECCGHLARVWMRQRSDAELTRHVLALGLKTHATRVWRLVARRATADLREDLAALVGRLGPAMSKEEKLPEPLLELGEALLGTPLETHGRALLKRLDAHAPREQRRRIARLLGDWENEAKLLEAELGAAQPTEALALLQTATWLLRVHPQTDLLAAGTDRLMAATRQEPPAEALPRLLEAWMGFQEAASHPETARELLRLRLGLADPGGQDLPDRCALLARLGRWEDLEALVTPAPDDKEGTRPFWLFRAATAQGRAEEARRWILAWLDQRPEGPAPGLCQAISLLQDQPERLTELASRCGPELLPGQEALLAREPWRILVALDPEAPAGLLPSQAEENLRWRLARLSRNHDGKALGALVEEAERALGSGHPLVAEVLLALGKEEKESAAGMAHLERALAILEEAPGDQARLKVEVGTALAEVRALDGDGPGLERALLHLMELLEWAPELEGELAEPARALPALLLLQLWREQRLQDMDAICLRAEALVKRAPGKEDGLGQSERAEPIIRPMRVVLDHLTRLQNQLRAAGLP